VGTGDRFSNKDFVTDENPFPVVDTKMPIEDPKLTWAGVRLGLIEHPTLAASFAYLLASSAGVAYSSAMLRHFGISFFDYAEFADFALSAFRKAFVLIVLVAAVGLIALYIWVAGRKDSHLTSKTVWKTLLVCGFAPALVGGMEGWKDALHAKTRLPNVEVHLLPLAPNHKVEVKTMSLITTAGTTSFFYDKDTSSAIAVPAARIHYLQFR
jgi:hypothetical protein